MLRTDDRVTAFVRHFVETGKPIAAIGHAPWLLIEAGAVANRRVTSYLALATDLENAGAAWIDEPVVVDDNLLTSRWPDDIDAFCNGTVHLIAERISGRWIHGFDASSAAPS